MELKSWQLNACVLVIASFLVYRVVNRRRGFRRPPGPNPLPFIGNLHQMPFSELLWERALEWGKEYGDVIYLENLGKPMLLINTYEAAVELLGNKSTIYSSRPHQVMMNELEDWHWLSLMIPYGEKMRKSRSFQHRFFNSPETLHFLDGQVEETRRTLKYLLSDPDNYEKYISRLPGALIMMNVYGHQIGVEDRFVHLGMSAIKSIAGTEDYLFLDFIPWLKYLPEWFPYANFQRVAREVRKVSHALQYEPHELTKKRMADGTATQCMTTILLNDNADEDGTVRDEDELREAAATVFLGGVHSSTTAMMTFVMCMLKNPEAMKRGQEEIDHLVGNDRLPTFDEWGKLPYVQAIYEETLRYASIAPLGFPRLTTADDTYKGGHIPAGTIAIVNQWAMAYDPDIHKDPYTFKPERWLPCEYGGEGRTPLPHNYTFGFGRRACVGQKWAEHLIFIAIASMLAVFDFEKALGEDGKPIPPNDNFIPGFARLLGPSKCKIVPRSEKAAALIESSFDDSET